VNDFTAFVGRNDIGKSCILEALDIFFNDAELGHDDLTKGQEESEFSIGCVFKDLPEELVLDAQAKTTLEQEHLLNEQGHLEILKTWDCSLAKPKVRVVARAHHPSADGVDDLLSLKQPDLRKRMTTRGVSSVDVDLRYNPQIRAALWAAPQDLDKQMTDVALDKEDAKAIWAQVEENLPIYALFKADRPSRDEDSEFQDPMKLAIKEALEPLAAKLEEIKEAVKSGALAVATRTLAKLHEIDSTLANSLTPDFKAEPKWDSLFKMSLIGDNEIPINKRGSGVRRLVLLSFFRAEVERRRNEHQDRHVIYAVEEPETSQHPKNQRLLVRTLMQLAEQDRQVFITTHNPALAGLVPVDDVRHIRKDAGQIKVDLAAPSVWEDVANELGVLPDNRVKVIVCVEGPHDYECFGQLSKILHSVEPSCPSLLEDARIAVVPVGGSNLQQWVQSHYLKGLGRPEAHWYDSDTDPAKHQAEVDAVNARGDGSFAVVSGKRELENYLHPDAIQEGMSIAVTVSDNNDLPDEVAHAVHVAGGGAVGEWPGMDPDKKAHKVRKAKRRLNREAASKMSIARLQVSDTADEIKAWLQKIEALASR